MTRSLVTAIIPVYNRHWCIRRAALSVLGQDYRPLEILIVDDGSTDDTPRVLDEIVREARDYPPVDLRVLRQENQGVSAARNLALRHAKGEWIAPLDSDDQWLPAKTSRQIQYFDARPDLQIAQTEEIWIRGGQRVNAPARLAKQEGDLFARCLDHCAISPSSVMLRRSLIEEIGPFDEAYPACEDYEMWLRVACRQPVGLLREALLVKHGGHDDQLSATVPTLDRYRIRAIVKTLDTAPLTTEQCALALEALRAKCRVYGKGCEKRGRQEEALEILALPERFERKA